MSQSPSSTYEHIQSSLKSGPTGFLPDADDTGTPLLARHRVSHFVRLLYVHILVFTLDFP